MRKIAITILLTSLLAFPVSPWLSNAQAYYPHEYKGRQYYEQRGDIVWDVPSEKKWIALTFDDGPDPAYTPQILELLKQYHAKATFFVIGTRVEQFPNLVKQEVNDEHEIANHSFHHVYMNHSSVASIQQEISQTQAVISKITGQPAVLFRPPGGVYNDVIVQASKLTHTQVIMWSWHQDTKDWNKPGVDRIVHQVVDHAKNGDIVLFHDHVNGSSQTVQALKKILPALQAIGFRFVTVSELLEQKNLNYFNEETD